jgi:hypothetical protein
MIGFDHCNSDQNKSDQKISDQKILNIQKAQREILFAPYIKSYNRYNPINPGSDHSIVSL